MLTVAQLAPLKNGDPYLYETLVKIVSVVNATSQRTCVDPSTPLPAPAPIASLAVHAANGWFDLAIADPANSRPGLFYFAESARLVPWCIAQFVRTLAPTLLAIPVAFSPRLVRRLEPRLEHCPARSCSTGQRFLWECGSLPAAGRPGS